VDPAGGDAAQVLNLHPVTFELRVLVMDPARNAAIGYVSNTVSMDKRPSGGQIVIIGQENDPLYTASGRVNLSIARARAGIDRFMVANTIEELEDLLDNRTWRDWQDFADSADPIANTITLPWILGVGDPDTPTQGITSVYLKFFDGVNDPSVYITGSIIIGQRPAGSAGVVSDLRITSLGAGSAVLRWHTQSLAADRGCEVYTSARPTGPFAFFANTTPPADPAQDEWSYTDNESVTPRFYKIKISGNGPLSADTVGKIRYDFFTAGQARFGINSFTLPFRTDLADNAPSFSMRSLELAQEINVQAGGAGNEVVEFIGSYNSRQQTSVGDTFLVRNADGSVTDVTPAAPDFTFLSIAPGVGYQISVLDRGPNIQGDPGDRRLPVWFVGQASGGETVAYRTEGPTRDPNVAAGGGGGEGAEPTPLLQQSPGGEEPQRRVSLTIQTPTNGAIVTESFVAASGTMPSGTVSLTIQVNQETENNIQGISGTTWSTVVSGADLMPGTNTIIVRAYDGANQVSQQSVSITYSPTR
jgi:hypothetical protein